MMSAKGLFVAAALSGGFLLALGNIAGGHWLYDPACCSDRDCKPVADAEVMEVPGGYQVAGEFVPMRDPRVRRPLDEQYHLCRHVTTNELLCIYPKLRGF